MWFKEDLERILLSKEQAARRDRSGERLESYLDALDDLRTLFGIPHRADFSLYQDNNSLLENQPFVQSFPISQLYLPPNHQEEEARSPHARTT